MASEFSRRAAFRPEERLPLPDRPLEAGTLIMPFGLLADLVLLLHLGVVVFIVGGLVMTWIGYFRGWRWVRSWRFRLLHLAAILVVVAEAWLGIVCPLTSLERRLRQLAGDSVNDAGFIENWVQSVLFYDFEPWVFTLAYTLFASLVVASWWTIPPHKTQPFRPEHSR